MPAARLLSRRFGNPYPGPPGTTGVVAILLLVLAVVVTLLASPGGH